MSQSEDNPDVANADQHEEPQSTQENEENIAEISQISAELDEAEKFELTFECVDKSIAADAIEEAKEEMSSPVFVLPDVPKRRSSGGSSRRSSRSSTSAKSGPLFDEQEIESPQHIRPKTRRQRRSARIKIADTSCEDIQTDPFLEETEPKNVTDANMEEEFDETPNDGTDDVDKENVPPPNKPTSSTPLRSHKNLPHLTADTSKRSPLAELILEEFLAPPAAEKKKKIHGPSTSPAVTPKRARI